MKRVWNVRDLSFRKFPPRRQASYEVAFEIAKQHTSRDWKNACETLYVENIKTTSWRR